MGIAASQMLPALCGNWRRKTSLKKLEKGRACLRSGLATQTHWRASCLAKINIATAKTNLALNRFRRAAQRLASFQSPNRRVKKIEKANRESEVLIMFKAVTDQNFDGRVTQGMRLHYPDLDLVRVQEVGFSRIKDPELLEWALSQERVV